MSNVYASYIHTTYCIENSRSNVLFTRNGAQRELNSKARKQKQKEEKNGNDPVEKFSLITLLSGEVGRRLNYRTIACATK